MALDGSTKLSDRIRVYVERTYVKPARGSGREVIIIRAGDVHSSMGLTGRQPAVCGVLRSHKFEREAGVQLLRRTGPYAGANVYYEFRIIDPDTPPAGTPPSQAAPVTSGAKREPRPLPAVAGKTVVLVSCVASKRAVPSPARDLYSSDWFLKARPVAEGLGVPWFILSAEYGLVAPDEVIAPYEKTLNTMPINERRAWAEAVFRQLMSAAPEVERVIFLAGTRYREFLAERLRESSVAVEVPMEGLPIGKQLSWLKQHADHG